MPGQVIVIDTSMLCVWLAIPGKDTCGESDDIWDYPRVRQHIEEAIKDRRTTLVFPLASILETGNFISQLPSSRFELAQKLAEIIHSAADEKSPWAAFTDQSSLWEAEALKKLATGWPELAKQKLSIGDATIKEVAQYYAKAGFEVEIMTGGKGLKAYQPAPPLRRWRL
ncbi:hypothetical protein [Gloeobacter kilaueensis]|uniref:PIN domain-containing protein n=1 Tax=Gloeobacter kilaueensis (strain ATCC BAA-2537 / CCAP 1431/1 / ULC 316 / JS1) TaxID=1183438 RepID=U5QIS4_GLOK1|nr:hypothetical protein [Gloeobacter kilaueensis]AGY58793.1 hypothetical protein GKIL_2547 [Gloeobacter kilaueensis JS1]